MDTIRNDPVPLTSAGPSPSPAPSPSPSPSPSPELLAFAERGVGELHDVEYQSPRGNSSVWRVTAGPRRRHWYLKQHATPTLHARETHAYTRWAPALGAGCAPALHAASPELSAVVLTELPGVTPHLPTMQEDDQQEIQRQLGLLLDNLHHAEAQRAPAATAPVLDRVQRHLDAARAFLTPADVRLVARMSARLATRPALPYVPTHGDVVPANTLWDPEARLLSLLDFDHADHGPAVRDLARLEETWAGRPDLRHSFFVGYGADLTRPEADHLQVLTTFDALGALAHAAATSDEDLLARGRESLTRLHGDAPRPPGMPGTREVPGAGSAGGGETPFPAAI